MGRLPLFVKTILIHLLSYLLNYIVIYGVFYAPTFLQSFPPTAALGDVLAKYYAWIGERNNLLRGLTGPLVLHPLSKTAPRPRAGQTPHPTALEAQVASPTQPTPVVTAGILVLKAILGVLYGGMFIFGVSKAGVFSLQRPLLDNIRVTVQYIVGGFKVVFGPAMLMAFLVWVGCTMTKATKEKATKTAQTGSVSALPEGQKPYTDEEKV
ncbi:hypothetical protein MVEN_01433700 [Mycena venus]|uniref:Uncharacterized protein n=1 Tax=Mycena venus TaxID=2733690 RepID=A0A8H6XZL5_9AGAR|nr:hypothetical protein MVEN_01433700 [Mycena venus]